MREIEVERAQVKLSTLLKEASAGRPTVITRDNEKLAVVLSYDDYKNLPGIQLAAGATANLLTSEISDD